jgi:hypothetical protein
MLSHPFEPFDHGLKITIGLSKAEFDGRVFVYAGEVGIRFTA